jgi:hypothetical protein
MERNAGIRREVAARADMLVFRSSKRGLKIESTKNKAGERVYRAGK